MSTRRTTKKPVGLVALVGTGAGDPGLLTLRAAELLRLADDVWLDPGQPLPELAGIAAEVHLAADEPLGAALVAAAREGRRVVRLLAGDPWLDPRGVTEAGALAKARLPFEVVPGVPVAVAVPTYAGIPAGLPRVVAAIDGTTDWATVATSSAAALLLGPATEMAKAAAALVEHGRRPDTPAAVTVNGTTPWQRTVVATLEAIGEEVATAGLTGDAVLMTGQAVGLRERLSWWETRALFGWQVLVPRTKDQSGELLNLLRGHGAVAVEVPTIAVEPPRTPAPMERAIHGLVSGRYAWIAFTSANAVKAVRNRLEEVGLDARAFAGVKIAAVGEATARSLRDFGLRADLLPGGPQSAEGLLADWPEYDDVFDPLDRVFLPRADIATETLVAGLKQRGWAVDDITAYRTVRASPPPAPVREVIKSGKLDAVVFTSSSTVRNLVGIAGKPHERTVVAAIGPATAATCGELGLRVDVLAEEASIPSTVEGLAAFALSRRAADAVAPPPERGNRSGRTAANRKR